MIRNIIFDMGNVLIYFDPETFLDRVDVTDAADREILMRSIYRSVEWAAMDRGTLTDGEASEIMKSRVPERLKDKVDLLVRDWNRPILPVAGMTELVRELKEAGYGIYLLSNASFHQSDYWPDIPGYEYFDGKMVSAYEKIVKPEKEIYERFLERFRLNADECVFIDDSIVNAEASGLVGIHPIVFHDDVGELRRELGLLGVKVEA